MQQSGVATSGAWQETTARVSTGRHTAGRLLILLGTAALAVALLVQMLHVFGPLETGFANWRPVLYVYLAWTVALCAGLALTRGERGQRALFVLPAVLFTISMVVFPTIFGFYIAFTDWNLSSQQGRQWSGLSNIRRLLNDGDFWNAMLNMVYYVSAVLVQYAIAFGLAMLLNQKIRFRKFFRVAFLLPFMLSPVAVSWMIGKSIFEMRYGPASMLARELGWESPAWFATPWIARFTMMSMSAWYSIPFLMVLLLAGLQALPEEVLESAKVDGANAWQSFRQMVFPLLLPVSVTAVVLRIIFELKLADIVLTVTGGAPGGATDTVTSFIYREYNTRSNVGYGTALAQFYLITIIIFIALLLWLANRWLRRVT